MDRWCIYLLLAICATPAMAAPPEGVVMQVADDEELFINLGTRDGLVDGAELRIFRRVVLTHPITEKSIEDRFPIGTVRVTEAGNLLSIIKNFKDLKRRPMPGDFVVAGRAPIARAKPAAECPTVAPAVPTVAAPAEPPELTDLQSTLLASMGGTPELRIEMLSAYQARYPNGSYRSRVAASLEELKAQLNVAPVAAAMVELRWRFDPVRKVEAQRPLSMAVAIVAPEPLETVRLLARRKGDPNWITVPMAPTGALHFTAAFPKTLLYAPGKVQYAIEAVLADGDVARIAGSLMEPLAMTVEPIPAGEGPQGPSRADFVFRFVDFNASSQGDDQYLQTEARFRYGLNYKALHAVEVGVGLISGEGGTVADLAAGATSDPVALGYAFAALELSLSDMVGLGGRFISGNRRTVDGSASSSSIGAQLHLRIGDDTESHLIAGIGVISNLGSRYFAEFHAKVSEKIPFTAAIEATDMPVGADFGARGSGTLGYEVTDWLTLRGEFGLNARTIKHYGYTAGGGLSFDWE
jgi:hypothetical protein